MPDTWVYIGGTNNDNTHISPANVTKYLDYCEGYGQTQVGGNDTGGAIVPDCPHPYWYASINMFEVTTSGGVTTDPWLATYADGSAGGGAGTCPSVLKGGAYAKQAGQPYGPEWASTDDTVNWGNFASGTTIGDPAGLIVGWGGSYYRIFTNWGSTAGGTSSMLAAINQVIKNCSMTRGDGIDAAVTVAFDRYEGLMSDNNHSGLQAYNAGLWAAGSGGYEQGVNWSNGSVISPSPYPSACTGSSACYASANCNSGVESVTFWNGASYAGACAQTAKINTNSATGGTATYAADSGGTSTLITANQRFVEGLYHHNGTTRYSYAFNGLWNGYDACQLANTIPNATVGIVEFGTLGPAENGKPNADVQQWQHINAASDDYACGGATKYAILDYYNSSKYNGGAAGTSAPGTPAYEMQQRLHRAFLWLLTNDAHPTMMLSWTQGCVESCPFSDWTDVYASDFAAVSGQVFTYPAEALGSSGQFCGENYYSYVFTGAACTQGGVRDSGFSVSASNGGTCTTAPSCVFRQVFNHFYVWDTTKCGTAYDRTKWGYACTKDIGPVAILLNLSGASFTLSNNNLKAALGNTVASEMQYVIEPGCSPLSGLYSSTAGAPLYPNDGVNGTPSTTVQCQAGTYYDVFNGSQMGGYPLSNLTITSTTGPYISDTEAVIMAAGSP